MKQALVIGCGNKRGSRIIDACLEAGYNVINIGSSESKNTSVKNIQINWKDLDLIKLYKLLREIDYKIDFIFFNQNGSSLSKIDFSQTKKTLDTWTNAHIRVYKPFQLTCARIRGLRCNRWPA